MKLYIKQYLILLFVATAFVSCQLPVDDDNGGGDDDNNSAHYKGPFSKLALDINMDRAMDIETSLIKGVTNLDPLFHSGLEVEGYALQLQGEINLLAKGQMEQVAYFPFGGPRLLGKEKGYSIDRGFTEELRFEDYWYGKQLFALGGFIDKDTGIMTQMLGNMVSDDIRYWCVLINTENGHQYGWIEYKCTGQAYLNNEGHWDTDIEIGDIYISEEINTPVIAGEK